MGLFSSKKLIGTVKIKFYGEDNAIVIYETNITDPEFVEHSKIELFAMYYAKILYNLGKSEHADKLIEYIQKSYTEVTRGAIWGKDGKLAIVKSEVKRPNILATGQKLVNEDSPEVNNFLKNMAFRSATGEKMGKMLEEEIKVYEGKLYQKSDASLIVQTDMSRGGEGYFAPVSVTMFFQYLINSLSEAHLAYLMVVLNIMNKYYREMGSYSDIHSIVDAPNFGFDSAAQLLNLNE